MAYKVGRCLLPDLLHNKGWTQQDLATRVGKTKQTISRYVNNQIIMSYETAVNISAEMGCNMSDLYEIIWIEE